MRLDGGYGFHRHYGKWEVMFGSPSSIIKEANANISRKKRREKDLLLTTKLPVKSINSGKY